MKPLDPPISQKEIEEKSKYVKEGKNPNFAMTVNLLFQLGVFEIPDNTNVACLLYGVDEDGNTNGYHRIMNQRLGKKSFIPREEEFWFEAAKLALGENVVGEYKEGKFVRTPIWKVLEGAKGLDLSIPWKQLDPVLILQIIASGQEARQKPASLELDLVKNTRPTPIEKQGLVHFHYSETRDIYRIGQKFRLSAGRLKRDEDFIVVEYSMKPFTIEKTGNAEYQGQHMRYFFRNKNDSDAFITDSEGGETLPFGEYGMLSGDHGFCLITFPKNENNNDPFGLRDRENLLTVEEFRALTLKLKSLVFHNLSITVNLVEYHLES